MRLSTTITILAVVSVLLCGVMWSTTRWYGQIQSVQGVSGFSSDHELFVFIGHSTAILSGNKLELLAKQLTSPFLVPEHVSDDLLVVHVRNGRISEYNLAKFGYGGIPFVYHGQLYWARGGNRGDTGTGTWKWSGSEFLPLSAGEASPLDHDIKDVDVANREEGWVRSTLTHAEMTCRVGDKEFRIFQGTETTPSGNSHDRVCLIEDADTNSPEVLIDLPRGYKRISRDQYLKLKQGIVRAR